MADDGRQLRLGRLTSEALRKATGRGWKAWLDALDSADATEWDHKQIVAHLEGSSPEVPGWWRQSITVGYEQARGKRVLGQTADAGFQVGVRRTVPGAPMRVWQLLTARPELWLGDGATLTFVPGARYKVPGGKGEPGVSGELRVVKPGDRLRMTWHPDGWPAPAALQLALVESGPERTAIVAHLEKLPDADSREELRACWQAALARIDDALRGPAPSA